MVSSVLCRCVASPPLDAAAASSSASSPASVGDPCSGAICGGPDHRLRLWSLFQTLHVNRDRGLCVNDLAVGLWRLGLHCTEGELRPSRRPPSLEQAHQGEDQTENNMLRLLTRNWKDLLFPVVPFSMRSARSGTKDRLKLANKVAVITGSTNGISFAIARRLAQDGAHVVVSSQKQENVDQAVAMLQREGLSVMGTVCQVGKEEDQERLVAKEALEHCGSVDFLVCVAGVNPLVGSTLESSEQVWDKILGVNVKAPALLLSQLLPHLEKSGQGSVVLVPSVAAYIPNLGVYNVSKTALLGLTKTLAVALAPKNIRVNCSVPGMINTKFSQVVRMKGSSRSYPTEHWATFSFQAMLHRDLDLRSDALML
ncbi:dehydrogenase/reductase SDR family member 2, mitochondrial-like [Nycticebus coucang]|uniref:dehydrogenase/reductase SDR family member 2, mitochondrial-like n=1 Tax=Nycticebus coucang TaxID=9470 RepID=UPI00234CC3EC|nr:dehydrogenase/reductase SDR family member 2, mitochondrial-like [Nycticebus coucang]